VRILAVTADASLLTALTSMMLDWEIKGVRDAQAAKDVSEGAQVVLVDSGSTARGIDTAKALWSAGVTLPSLVIGDTTAPDDARVRVIVRPFSLQDLTAAVDEVSGGIAIDPRVGNEPAAGEEPVVADEPAHAEPQASQEPTTTAAAIQEALRETATHEPPVVQDHELTYTREDAVASAEHEYVPEEPEPIASVTHLPVQPAGGFRRLLRRREGGHAVAEAVTAEDPMVRRLKAAIDAARDLESLVGEIGRAHV